MTLQSLSYLLFLLAAWVTARVAPRGRRLSLLLFSYAFYWTWSPTFLGLLAVATLVNYAWVRALRRRSSARVLWAALGCNLLLVSFFKYLPSVSRQAGVAESLWNLAIPIGISFYTFQAMSYLVDVYRGHQDQPNLLEFALYLAFWPTILAGPICRLPEMLPQFRSTAPPTRSDVSEGVHRIILGLFLKVVLADTLALGVGAHPGVLQSFGELQPGNALDVWVLCLGYGFQIYFDFAGYSHMAIGSARLFGIRLRENFQAPFMASTISDFWGRWHMSLSSWIRDYLFFPLATARGGLPWRNFSLVASMMVFGLWHGPRLTYLLWGLYHGLLLAVHRQLQQWRRMGRSRAPAWLDGALSWTATFAAVTAGWILFASPTVGRAGEMARWLVDFSSPSQLDPTLAYLVVATALLYFLMEGCRRALEAGLGLPRWAWLSWYAHPVYLATLLLLVLLWSDRSSPFVYVQF